VTVDVGVKGEQVTVNVPVLAYFRVRSVRRPCRDIIVDRDGGGTLDTCQLRT
jgi:hypothetical protein